MDKTDRPVMNHIQRFHKAHAEAHKGTVKTGSTDGKSNALGHGGRAQQLKNEGVPGGVIGEIAREKGAAPGQPNYHGGKK